MRSRLAVILFTVLAPITVPAYALFLVVANLVGGAFYVVIEAGLVRLLRRPISLSRSQQWLLLIPILLAAPIATAINFLIWAATLVTRGLAGVGRWQAATKSRAASLTLGIVWCLVALWTTVCCLNASVGSAWIGRPVHAAADLFVETLVRQRSLGSLPPDMQQRRRVLIDELETYQDTVHRQWKIILSILQDDDARASEFRHSVILRKLTGLPWFFTPARLSSDGSDHSELLLGTLFFCWMLLIRWPGMFRFLRSRASRTAAYVVRVAAPAAAAYWVVTWRPLTDYYSFFFEEPSFWFRLFSPFRWLGADPHDWVRPEWYLLNAAIWIAILLVLARLWQIAWRKAPLLGWPRYYIAFLASRLLQRKRIAFFSVGAVTLCVAMMIIVISVMGGFVDSIRTRAHGLLGDLIVDGGLQGFPYYQPFIDRLNELRDKDGRPFVAQATPVLHTYGILQFPNTKKTTAVNIRGIRLDEYVNTNEFGKDLFYNERYGGTTLGLQKQPVYSFDDEGRPILPADMEARWAAYLQSLSPEKREEALRHYHREPHDLFAGPGIIEGPKAKAGYEGREIAGVIIGRNIIANRTPSGEFHRNPDYPRGQICYLTLMPLTRTGDVSPEPPLKPSFRYVDDSRTGIHEIDSTHVYVDFEILQKLLSMEAMPRAGGDGTASARCSQIQIKLVPRLAATRAATLGAKETIRNLWSDFLDQVPADAYEADLLRSVDLVTWEEMQRNYIAAIEKEKFLVLIMFGVISIVAVFLILCIFYMIVQEKTRDIGIIKSVGGSAEGVAAVFLAYGGGIGLIGCILGGLLGTTFVEHINDVQDWLARLNPDWRVWSPETYSFDKIPDAWKWSEVIWISILAIVASVLGATFPALRAGRTWPVESLRYE